MRVNPIGWFLVALFLVGGIAFWITLPWVGIGQIWVAVALGLAALYLFLGRRAARARRLRQDGIPGEATIVGITQTGTEVNRQPMFKLRLRVEAEGVAPFEADKRVVVPLVAVPLLTNGAPLPVFLDRNDPQEFTIDWELASGPFTLSHEGGAPIAISDPRARMAALRAMREHGVVPGGNTNLRDNPAARAAVLRALRGGRGSRSAGRRVRGRGPRAGAAPATAGADGPQGEAADHRRGVPAPPRADPRGPLAARRRRSVFADRRSGTPGR
jgi:hypothetical protein